jgi:hypothetical protein
MGRVLLRMNCGGVLIVKAKDYKDVTLKDVIGVMTDKEKEDLYFHVGLMAGSFSKMKDGDKLVCIANIIKKVTGVNDLKLLYYGRTLFVEIGEG